MAHDPEVYDSPFEFNPERFLSPSITTASTSVDPESPVLKRSPETDVRSFIFGFGRRICPGEKLADAVLFMAAAMSLAAFDLRVPEGARKPGYEFCKGTLT